MKIEIHYSGIRGFIFLSAWAHHYSKKRRTRFVFL